MADEIKDILATAQNIRGTIDTKDVLEYLMLRYDACRGSCNSAHIHTCIGQIEAACFLLSKDRSPVPYIDNLKHVFDYLKVPNIKIDRMVFYGENMEAEKEKYLKLKEENGQDFAEENWDK